MAKQNFEVNIVGMVFFINATALNEQHIYNETT